MNDPARDDGDRSHGEGMTARLPRPNVRPLRWYYALIWIIPIAAAVVAGYYLYERRSEQAIEVRLRFNDASGIKPGETTITNRGVEIGIIQRIMLVDDNKYVQVVVKLKREASAFARGGARFWIERPKLSAESLSGISNLFSGAKVGAEPGTGPETHDFVGLDDRPPVPPNGLTLFLHAPRLEQLQPESPIFYRGIQIGAVEETKLGKDATGVDVRIVIRDRYATLVHLDSKFWKTKGANVEGGIFSGLELKVNSLRALLSGGITLATPTANGPRAGDGSDFPLYDNPEKDWESWSPKIEITPDVPNLATPSRSS